MSQVLVPSVRRATPREDVAVQRFAALTSLPLWAHITGSLFGSLALASVLLAVKGLVVPSASTVPFAFAAIAIAGLSLLPAQWSAWLPQSKAQVRREWLDLPSLTATAAGWGFVLGAGLLTRIITPAFYGFLALCLTQPLHTVIVATIAYGVARGASIMAFGIIFLRGAPERVFVFLRPALASLVIILGLRVLI